MENINRVRKICSSLNMNMDELFSYGSDDDVKEINKLAYDEENFESLKEKIKSLIDAHYLRVFDKSKHISTKDKVYIIKTILMTVEYDRATNHTKEN